MSQPVIGIPFMGKSLFRQYMLSKYLRCLKKAGAEALILPTEPVEEVIAQSLEKCDGFLFPGGPDIQPELYDQTRLPVCGESNPARDALELPLIRAVCEAGKPLLCICRGMQLLNVAFGGTLAQDISQEQEYPHSDFSHRATATHPIRLEPGTWLYRLFASDSISVNSMHHQAVDILGSGLQAAAYSPDGFVEAICFSDYPLCLAVQWHPEHMAARNPEQQRIFNAFVQTCGGTDI